MHRIDPAEAFVIFKHFVDRLGEAFGQPLLASDIESIFFRRCCELRENG